MKLKEFIKESLFDIDKALEEVSSEFNDYNYKYGSNSSGNNSINFDVQVYAGKGTETDGGLGINVAGFKIGTNGTSENSDYQLSKISFNVVRENTAEKDHKDKLESSNYDQAIIVDNNKYL